MPSPLNNKNYRLGVGVMLVNSQKKVLVGRREDIPKYTMQNAWQMPQGGIDEGEDAKTAALRELLEEIGTNQVNFLYESHDWFYYDLPDDLKANFLQGYDGQKQKWYIALLLGPDSLINIHTSHPEFIDWKWVEFNELVDLIVDFKKPMYKQIVKEFGWYFKE